MKFGPILHYRGYDGSELRLAVIVLRDAREACGVVATDLGEVQPEKLADLGDHTLWRAEIALPAGGTPAYSFEGESYTVRTDFETDLRIGFASCNGEENGDLDREAGERNAMWAEMARTHEAAPFHLLLQGGDQVYADEVQNAHPLSEGWPFDLDPDPGPEALAELETALRQAFLERYAITFGAPGFAELAARVPSLMMWDDHDICDGWGSLGADITGHPVGQRLFGAAREAFLLYQLGATEADLPDLLLDSSGKSLSWRHDLPGLTLFAPDLRSERTPNRVMGLSGWTATEAAMRDTRERVLLISSVPLLGPRLSIVEWLFNQTGRMEKYEDDLRDQWQSRAHREEWQRMLGTVLDAQKSGSAVTAISGEIHVATRAEMSGAGSTLHQLVSSGISHRPPPRAYGVGLGLLSRLGEAPLQGHPIRIKPLPGRWWSYSLQRNFLVIERVEGRWRAAWHLEKTGRTPWMAI